MVSVPGPLAVFWGIWGEAHPNSLGRQCALPASKVTTKGSTGMPWRIRPLK